MSRLPLRCYEHPEARLILSRRMNNMKTIEQVKKAFHEARIAGEELLSQGKITWEEYTFTMVGYELTLQNMGVNL
ncbi:Uncharacterised protein [uncultured archaeon]|nr:Uncharacterised protein [uncultured archaeon]